MQESAERLTLIWEEEWADQPNARRITKVEKLCQLPAISLCMLRMQPMGGSDVIQSTVDGLGRQALRDIRLFSGSMQPLDMSRLLKGFSQLHGAGAWLFVTPRSETSMYGCALLPNLPKFKQAFRLFCRTLVARHGWICIISRDFSNHSAQHEMVDNQWSWNAVNIPGKV